MGLAAPALATVPASLPTSCIHRTTAPENYWFCDDGVPDFGGTTANLTGAKGITVPAKYGGDGFTGLPAKAADAATVPGADPAGNIALDVDISLPGTAPPVGGYPLILMMHGCCAGSKTGWEAEGSADGARFDAGGERWHYNNAWFASRGYVVINYTARGFVDADEHGSTGQAQLDSRRFEINDFQHLGCQLLASMPAFDATTEIGTGAINPQKVVTTGGSYGGGFSWLAFTDPKWTCTPADTGVPIDTDAKLAASAPKYGWTDLVDSLVPTGLHMQDPSDLPDFNGCDSGPVKLDGSACPNPQSPVGLPKRSINAGLYASGKTGVPPGTSSHTTFPASIDEAQACLSGFYPGDSNPACANTLANTLPEFLRDRSAYYQNDFFASIAGDASYRIPLFDAATFTDPLFPPVENRRMINRLLQVVPGYPVQAYYGDYQHFTQNKAKIWGDVCDSGGTRHVCNNGDFDGDLNGDPPTLARLGVTTRLNRFIDHYAGPSGDASQPQPSFNVTAELQICPQNAADAGRPADEGGDRFTATTFGGIAPNSLDLDLPGVQTTTSTAFPNPHAVNDDPVGNSLAQTNGAKCPVETQPAGPGVASYDSDPLPADATMVGATRVTIDFTTTDAANSLQLNSRLYDVFPDGTQVMVDRGPRRLTASEEVAGHVVYQLHSNGWRFKQGHRLRIEIAQDDDPYLHRSDVPSSTSLSRVQLSVPIRESSQTGGGGPTPTPVATASDATPPQTAITKGPKKGTAARKATFAFSSSEAGSSFQCKRDRRPYKPCLSPQTYRHLKPGKHRFRVQARDAAGNVDPTPAKRTWTVQ